MLWLFLKMLETAPAAQRNRTGLRVVVEKPGSDLGIYLPIAELSVNMLVLLGMGAAVGFLSGLWRRRRLSSRHF